MIAVTELCRPGHNMANTRLYQPYCKVTDSIWLNFLSYLFGRLLLFNPNFRHLSKCLIYQACRQRKNFRSKVRNRGFSTEPTSWKNSVSLFVARKKPAIILGWAVAESRSGPP